MITAEAETTTGEQPKSTKKPRVGAQRAHGAPKKAKSAPKAKAAKKASKTAKKATEVRDGSKSAKVLDLLKRPNGTTLTEAHESHRLAGAFSSRLPVRYDPKEDGPRRCVPQGRRRGAHLLPQGLSIASSVPSTSPGSRLAACFVDSSVCSDRPPLSGSPAAAWRTHLTELEHHCVHDLLFGIDKMNLHKLRRLGRQRQNLLLQPLDPATYPQHPAAS